MIKIVADENIPLIKYYFGDAILKPGREITQKDLIDADILLVRAVTLVNQDLLEGTKVKFVGTTTTGIDHLDTSFLDHAGILYASAFGCNADAVAEYVVCTIAHLQTLGFLTGKKPRAAVIGVGNTGRRVVQKLKLLGFSVIVSDPPRAMLDKNFISAPLEEICNVDLVTLHTPLTKEGLSPTYHMINKDFLTRQKKNCILMNTSRGSVVSSSDLKLYGAHLVWCLDVWENEPWIDVEIMEQALLATPHIAGYSVESKYRGIAMVYAAAYKLNLLKNAHVPLFKMPETTLAFEGKTVDWREVILKVYDPASTTKLMKSKMIEQNNFDFLRKNFQERHEFGYVQLENLHVKDEDQRILQALF